MKTTRKKRRINYFRLYLVITAGILLVFCSISLIITLINSNIPRKIINALTTIKQKVEVGQLVTSANDDGKLIEVSYQQQKLYYYENGELIFTSDVVTGNEDTDIIPYGTYYVQNMVTDTMLYGDDYAKHVDYWIGFDNETGGHMVGFHDASWRTVFGGDEWKINPTLECVNMPTDMVKKLYGNVEIGTEIRIHD